MCRRIVTLLLLFAVVVMQSLLAIGHAHVSARTFGHEPRPHIHLNLGLARHLHDPGMQCCRNWRLADGFGSHLTGRTELSAGEDHDSNAVYLDGLEFVLFERSTLYDQLAWMLDVTSDATQFCAGHPVDGRYGGLAWRDWQVACHGRGALYLRQHVLLI